MQCVGCFGYGHPRALCGSDGNSPNTTFAKCRGEGHSAGKCGNDDPRSRGGKQGGKAAKATKAKCGKWVKRKGKGKYGKASEHFYGKGAGHGQKLDAWALPTDGTWTYDQDGHQKTVVSAMPAPTESLDTPWAVVPGAKAQSVGSLAAASPPTSVAATGGPRRRHL